MEFHEKLQELRKGRGLTQEELAEDLYVSRTAISKWESGRGYPNIDSLKEISRYFSVTIDDLLSGEKLLSIAEREHNANLRNMSNVLLGMLDLCSVALIVLPLYPNIVNDYVYSVNLLAYNQAASLTRLLYWGLFLLLVATGMIKLLLTKLEREKANKIMTCVSMTLSVLGVMLLAVTKQAYAVIVIFLLLIIKSVIYFKYAER